MRQPQNIPATDFDAGVQAGLKTAVDFLERLAVRVQKSETAHAAHPPPPPNQSLPAPSRLQAAKATRP
jgi:hypothetical protein